MDLAFIAAERWTCLRAKVWAVIVQDWVLVSTWYNWSARWELSCQDLWECFLVENHCVRCLHAEENAIINAARIWVSVKWADIYCTHKPCDFCVRRIINSWIKKVYYREDYSSYWSITWEMFLKYHKV